MLIVDLNVCECVFLPLITSVALFLDQINLRNFLVQSWSLKRLQSATQMWKLWSNDLQVNPVFFTLFCLEHSSREENKRFTWIRFACFWASKWDRPAVRGTLDFAYFCLMTGQLLDSSSSGGTARRGRAWCGISDISCVCIRDGGVVLRVTHTDARRWWLSQQGWNVFLFSLQGGSSCLLCLIF